MTLSDNISRPYPNGSGWSKIEGLHSSPGQADRPQRSDTALLSGNEKMNERRCLLVGGVTGLLAVALGAFGAHGIEGALPGWYTVEDLDSADAGSDLPEAASPAAAPTWYQLDQLHQKKLKTWITGVRYHFYHTLAILAVGLLGIGRGKFNRMLGMSALFFLLGIIGFSGSLYLYVLSKIRIFGMTAALGGTTLLLGWLFFLIGMLQLPARQEALPDRLPSE